MRSIESLRSQIRAAAHERHRARAQAPELGTIPFVTVSRQAGAGGRTLAGAILEEFAKRETEPQLQGWSTFDEELCSMIVSDPELNVSFRELVTEDYRTRADDFVSVLLGKSFQDDVQKKIAVAVRQLALAGKAILIGRGAALITRDLERGVHLRLCAPIEARVQHMSGAFDISETEAARWVKEQDRSRARMVKSRFGRDIDDPLLYDAVWNTDRVPMPVIARCAAEMILSR